MTPELTAGVFVETGEKQLGVISSLIVVATLTTNSNLPTKDSELNTIFVL
jgi:hypothetical protein